MGGWGPFLQGIEGLLRPPMYRSTQEGATFLSWNSQLESSLDHFTVSCIPISQPDLIRLFLCLLTGPLAELLNSRQTEEALAFTKIHPMVSQRELFFIVKIGMGSLLSRWYLGLGETTLA